MKKIIYLMILNTLFALPRFSVEQGSNCINCHINPTGSGMRNDHGSNVYTFDELTARKWISKSNEDWDGYISDQIQIGGEFRIQSFDGNRGKSTFPMQAELYTNVDINKNANLYFEISLGGFRNYEYFVLFDKIPNKSWIKIGQSSPTYGLMVDDHTSFIKAGNKDELILVNRDLDIGLRSLFDPSYKKPLLVEFSVNPIKNIYLTSSIFQPYNTLYNDLKSFTTTINYIKDLDKWSLLLGSSILKQDETQLLGIFGGFSIKNFTVTYEVDRIQNLIREESFASYLQFVYKPIQGLHIITKYDYFDYDADIASGSISRYSYGLEFYPLNILEIKFQIRDYTIDYINTTLALDQEYLLQIHTWF